MFVARQRAACGAESPSTLFHPIFRFLTLKGSNISAQGAALGLRVD